MVGPLNCALSHDTCESGVWLSHVGLIAPQEEGQKINSLLWKQKWRHHPLHCEAAPTLSSGSNTARPSPLSDLGGSSKMWASPHSL